MVHLLLLYTLVVWCVTLAPYFWDHDMQWAPFFGLFLLAVTWYHVFASQYKDPGVMLRHRDWRALLDAQVEKERIENEKLKQEY